MTDRNPRRMTRIRRWDSGPEEVRDIDDLRNVMTRSLSTSDLSILEIDTTFSQFMERAIERTRNMKSETEGQYIPHLKTSDVV
jgi:hypothetical protein